MLIEMQMLNMMRYYSIKTRKTEYQYRLAEKKLFTKHKQRKTRENDVKNNKNKSSNEKKEKRRNI